MEKLTALLKSRRFWIASAGVIGVVGKEFGLELDEETITSIAVIVAAWLLGDSLRETKV